MDYSVARHERFEQPIQVTIAGSTARHLLKSTCRQRLSLLLPTPPKTRLMHIAALQRIS